MPNEFEENDLLRILREPAVWDPPVFITAEQMEEILETVDSDDERAEALCEGLLAGPSTKWLERFRAKPEAWTAGMVRRLLARVPALLECRPADALQATTLAIAIAEVLDEQAYWPDHVLIVRGQALCEHARVLSFLGRDREALKYVDHAERTFAQVPGDELDLAPLKLVKASVLRTQNRSDEALALTRAAAKIFLGYGERERYLHAQLAEADILSEVGSVKAALEIWTSIVDDRELDMAARERVADSIAACL